MAIQTLGSRLIKYFYNFSEIAPLRGNRDSRFVLARGTNSWGWYKNHRRDSDAQVKKVEV